MGLSSFFFLLSSFFFLLSSFFLSSSSSSSSSSLSNGKIPAPLHQVSRPPGRRLSCVTFLAPEKEVVLEGGDTPLYRTIRTGDLKTMMAKRWRYREGTLQPS